MNQDWHKRLSAYAPIDDSYQNANCVTEYTEGVPPDVGYIDMPYPPPDTYRIYRPQGLLGQDITERIGRIYADDATTPDWWLIERQEEVGYSEFTMESDYTYTVRIHRGMHFTDLEFDSISALINWIGEEQ